MAPSTRHSCLITANIRAALSQTNGAHSENVLDSQSLDLTSTSTQCTAVNQNNPDLSGIHTTCGKHTFVSSDTTTVPSPTPVPTEALQGIPSKRARVTGGESSPEKKGPTNARPMPLQLPSEGETMVSSFYPGHGDNTHSLTSLQVDPGNKFSRDSDLNKDNIENEDDWLEDEQTVNVTHKVLAKTSEVTITERPSWLGVDVTPPGTMQTPNRNVLDVDASGSAKNHGSAVSTPHSRTLSELGAPTIDLSAAATTSQTEATTDYSGAMWPTDTDLLPLGSNKLLLTNQYPLVCNVVQEAIEHLRASLMFNHAFPTAPIAFAFTKESLITAAKKLKPGAVHIQRRLQQDEDYLAKVVPLVAAMACRGGMPPVSARSVGGNGSQCRQRQLTVSAVMACGHTRGCCMLGDRGGLAGSCIISTTHFRPREASLLELPHVHTPAAINASFQSYGTSFHWIAVLGFELVTLLDTYYSSGALKPALHQGHDGILAREVPVPMVALVATAVFEFSANTYLDVYRCNAGTLNYILNSRPNAYHVMMANIYTQASSNTRHDDSPDVEIADLDLNDLED
ncbi:hypothetical protein H4582DRAFT_2059537 [Lactarius indigo]|nr:hypothetical protein H4582DRAFT_2059537 [Lactarius indigo]